ncbi:D-serine ammonia-lyase [Candidatus Symbiopectobacterium endolongispinus]|nr:D-serine ammonia-lyase [Candidatus Symbiopectobacterium sp. PLON1]MBT9429001.1 D-serine ammonia-lyase [Candidatus Symbiopectobacterium endolongispinus]
MPSATTTREDPRYPYRHRVSVRFFGNVGDAAADDPGWDSAYGWRSIRRKGDRETIVDIHIKTLIERDPLMACLVALRDVTWFNPESTTLAEGLPYVGLGHADVQAADARLRRFAPYLRQVFPALAASEGIIEYDMVDIAAMQTALDSRYGKALPGKLWLKKDSHLPISGSIKARVGIYEVLVHAEQLALQAGLITVTDDYRQLANEDARHFFSQYRIAVGSTGNLGMSIGIMGATLGFKVSVHMSADARQWKKDRLRAHGVDVVEYQQDYGVAVEQGRKAAQDDPYCFFIDDENSRSLFLGYVVAGDRLKAQFVREITRGSAYVLAVRRAA